MSKLENCFVTTPGVMIMNDDIKCYIEVQELASTLNLRLELGDYFKVIASTDREYSKTIFSNANVIEVLAFLRGFDICKHLFKISE